MLKFGKKKSVAKRLKSDMNNSSFTWRHLSWIRPPRWTAGNRFFFYCQTARIQRGYLGKLCLADGVRCVTGAAHILPTLVNFQSNDQLHQTTDPASVQVAKGDCPYRPISSSMHSFSPSSFRFCLDWTSSCRSTTSLTLILECSAGGLFYFMLVTQL